MIYLYSILLFVVGACLGSFAAALAWRLRVRQLSNDQQDGHSLSAAEKKELTRLKKVKKPVSKDRSLCLHCGRELTPLDLIPVVSWLWLRGKCRTCKKPIGTIEFAAEVGLGLAFVVSYLAWPFGTTTLGAVILAVLWAILLVLLTIHIVYDARWFLLLDVVTIAIGVVVSIIIVVIFTTGVSSFTTASLINWLGSLLLLPGLYGLLYVLSQGRWIGFGDVKLLVPLALLLSTWQHAFFMLFLANLLGCAWIIPGVVSKKITRATRIPFGPFLVLAWFIAVLWGTNIIELYMQNMLNIS